MNESSLRELIHASGDDVRVSPPPHAAIAARARARRSRTLMLGAATGTAAVILSAVAVQQSLSDSESSPGSPGTQAPTSIPSLPPGADFRGTWQVDSMVTTDPMIRDSEASITDTYVRPEGLTLVLRSDSWRAEVSCDFMAGSLRVGGDEFEHVDPVTSEEEVCPDGTAENEAIVGMANVMMRVGHWSMDDGELTLHSPEWRILAVLAPTQGDTEPQWPTPEAFEYSNRVGKVADRDDRFVGYSSADRQTRLTVYGVGASPFPELQAVIDEAPPGIEVTWVTVPFLESELRTTIRTAWNELPNVTFSSYNNHFYVDIGVCPKQPGQLATIQELADGLETPAPIRVKIQPPAMAGTGNDPSDFTCEE